MRACVFMLLVLAPIAVFVLPLYPLEWNEAVPRAAARFAIDALESTAFNMLDVAATIRERAEIASEPFGCQTLENAEESDPECRVEPGRARRGVSESYVFLGEEERPERGCIEWDESVIAHGRCTYASA